MKQLEYVLNNEKEVLAFLKEQYPLYHLSNVFFRDVQYGIQKMFERRGDKLSYPNAEKTAREFAAKMEKEKVFVRIDQQSWSLNYPEYKKPVVAPAPAAKPAAGAAPAKSPAAGGPRPALPPLGSAKPAGGTGAAKPTLPPLSSAKPAGGVNPALPPLSSAKPVGGAKPSLPPLASAKPASAAPPATVAAPSVEAKPSPQQDIKQETQTSQAETPKAEVPKAATQPGARKGLPPLRGSYTPAGKK